MFALAPVIADRYLLSVLILVFYFAYLGHAWNLLMGFAGQLSLGHALYLGLGAYTATALWTLFGIGPWLGIFVAIPVATAAGLFIGWLGWRFAIEGRLFRAADHRFRRIHPDRLRQHADHRRRRAGCFCRSTAKRPASGGISAAGRCCIITCRWRWPPPPPC